MKSLPQVLRRRLLAGGSVVAAIYAAFVLAVVASDSRTRTLPDVILAVGMGASIAFAIGATLFGLIPHLIGTLMSRATSFYDLLNHSALVVALGSVMVGVMSALAMIFGAKDAGKPLLVAIPLFIGAAATMCTLKFFFANRARE